MKTPANPEKALRAAAARAAAKAEAEARALRANLLRRKAQAGNAAQRPDDRAPQALGLNQAAGEKLCP